jgi:hypothetical protein
MIEEIAFIDAFIVSEKRDRLKELLSKGKRRMKMLQDLAHFHHFDHRWYKPVTHTENLESVLRQKGAPSICHVISEDAGIDGKTLALSEALNSIVGHGMGTILICIPDKLAYYEGEGPSSRGILEKDAT